MHMLDFVLKLYSDRLDDLINVFSLGDLFSILAITEVFFFFKFILELTNCNFVRLIG